MQVAHRKIVCNNMKNLNVDLLISIFCNKLTNFEHYKN